MDIAAIKRKTKLSKPSNSLNTNKKAAKIAIRLNTTLHVTMRNYLASMHASADYKYNSVSDILRHVLTSIADKSLKLSNIKAPVSDSDYIELTLRCTHSQKEFWQTLPSGSKVRILEKAIIAFLQI